MWRGSIRLEKVILYVFQTLFSAFHRSRPAHFPKLFLSVCSSTNSARFSAQVLVNRSPRQLSFFTPHFWHYANHFPDSLTWFDLQFCTPGSTERTSPTVLVVSRRLYRPFATFDFESTPRDYFAVSFARSARNSAYFCPSPHRLDVKLRDNHARFVSLNAPHLMSTPRP